MQHDESLAAMRALVALSEHGSFTLAARALRVSRTAVSKAIERLETRRKVRLLSRTARELRLTDEGLRFLDHCREVLDAIARAEASLAVPHRAVSGTVRLSVPPVFGRQRVMPILNELSRRHAALLIDVDFDQRRHALVSDGFDLAVRIGELPDSAALIARRVGEQTTVLCASRAYVARHGAPRDIVDLTNHRCLTEGHHDGSHDAWQTTEGEVRVRPSMRLRDATALLDAARGDLGIAQLPQWMVAADIARGELVQVLPGLSGRSLPIHLVWPAGRHLPARVRCVIDGLVERFGASDVPMTSRSPNYCEN